MVYRISGCAYAKCKTNALPREEWGPMLCFPTNDNLREKWINLIGRADLLGSSWSKIKHYRVCNLHFDDNDFNTKEKKKLVRGRVPCMYVCEQPELQVVDDIPLATTPRRHVCEQPELQIVDDTPLATTPCRQLEAYSNLVTALRAQGLLTKRRKKLLEDASNILHIPIERHKAEIRRAVNDDCLTAIAELIAGPRTSDIWKAEGRRTTPLIRRDIPQTAFTAIADQAVPNSTLPIPSFILPDERVTIRPIENPEKTISKEKDQEDKQNNHNKQDELEPPFKKPRLIEERDFTISEKEISESYDPIPSTSKGRTTNNKNNEPQSDICNKNKDNHITPQPSTSSGISRNPLINSRVIIPSTSNQPITKEISNSINLIEGHSSISDSTQSSSIKDNSILSNTIESAASPKPVDQVSKSNVVIVQKNSNSQAISTRNITISQETIKKLISAGTQTHKQFTLSSGQKINFSPTSQGNVIVVDLSQKQQTKNPLVNQILQASGLLPPKSPPIEKTEENQEESKESYREENSNIVNMNDHIKEDELIEESTFCQENTINDENFEAIHDPNVPEPIQYEETMEEQIETERLEPNSTN